MAVYRLVAWTRFFDPVERVWDVKTDLSLARQEFPFWARFDVDDLDRYAACFEQQTPCELQGHLGLARIPWPVRLEAVRRNEYFRDSSKNAVFSLFRHEHSFEPTADGCRYLDSVTFQPALPGAQGLAWFTERLFIHRHRASARQLHADRHATAVTMLRQLFDDEPVPT